VYRRCGERKILTSASLREAANTDLDLWLPEEYRKAVAATLSARRHIVHLAYALETLDESDHSAACYHAYQAVSSLLSGITA
jgi:hypothetical protein